MRCGSVLVNQRIKIFTSCGLCFTKTTGSFSLLHFPLPFFLVFMCSVLSVEVAYRLVCRLFGDPPMRRGVISKNKRALHFVEGSCVCSEKSVYLRGGRCATHIRALHEKVLANKVPKHTDTSRCAICARRIHSTILSYTPRFWRQALLTGGCG